MTSRTPYDGQPYYCDTCGLGLGEYYACEDGGCALESAEEAQERKRKHDTATVSSAEPK